MTTFDLVEQRRNRRLGTRIAVEVGWWDDAEVLDARVRVLCETHGDWKPVFRRAPRVTGNLTDYARIVRQERADKQASIRFAHRLAAHPWEWCEGCRRMLTEVTS